MRNKKINLILLFLIVLNLILSPMAFAYSPEQLINDKNIRSEQKVDLGSFGKISPIQTSSLMSKKEKVPEKKPVPPPPPPPPPRLLTEGEEGPIPPKEK